MKTKKVKPASRDISLPLNRTSVISLAVGFALMAGSWFGLQTIGKQFEPEQAKAAALRSEISAANQRGEQLSSGQDPLASKVSEAIRIDALLPAQIDKATIAQTLPGQAAQYGLAIQMNTLQAVTTSTLTYQPVTVTATGEYTQLVNWLSFLQSNGNLKTLGDVTITKVDQGGYSMAFTLKIWSSKTKPLVEQTPAATTPDPRFGNRPNPVSRPDTGAPASGNNFSDRPNAVVPNLGG
jgi:Tfp pilus assembly protein PilO